MPESSFSHLTVEEVLFERIQVHRMIKKNQDTFQLIQLTLNREKA